MHFSRDLKELGKSLLEGEGCTARQFEAYLNIVRYFGYTSLAMSITVNASIHGNRYKCVSGMIENLFQKYVH